MFYFYDKGGVTKEIKMRDEWGELRTYTLVLKPPRLTDRDLADELGTDPATVYAHRRD